MKLSMMSYTMSRQPGFDVLEMLKLTRELEMDGIDFVTLHGKKPKELKMMAEDLGIPVVCHTFFAGELANHDVSVRSKGIDICKRSIEEAVILGAPIIMIPTPGVNGMGRSELRKLWIKGLKEVIPFTTDAKLILTVENFPGANSPFVIADDMLEAIEVLPELRITYDNGNAGSGEDPAESFAKCSKYVVHAHFKDWDIQDAPGEGRMLMLDGKYFRPALIGEGNIDQKSCVTALKNAGYEGFVNIEYEGDKYKAADAVRKAVEYLRNIGILD